MFTKKPNIEHEYMQYSTDDIIGDSKENKQSFLTTSIRFLIVLILLGILFLGGVFGYRYLQKGESKISQSNINKESVNYSKTTTSKVQQKHKKMYTQDEMEAIVATIMSKVEKERKSPAIQERKTEQANNAGDEELLLNALEKMEADNVKDMQQQLDAKDINIEKEVIQSANFPSVDTHNQVEIYNSNYTKDVDDISNKITQIVSDMKSKKQKPDNYVSSLSTEVTTRKDAMRILVVKKGDTLSKIAKRAYGSASAYQKIYNANPDLINNPNKIYIGQKLRIPQL